MSPRPAAAAIVLAAGAGRRLGADEPKAFLSIGGRPILAVAAAAAAASGAVDELIVTAPEGFEDRARSCVESLGIPCTVIAGGDSRQASVSAALSVLSAGIELVAVHDAARPFAPPALFASVLEAIGDDADGAIPILPVADTVKRVLDGFVVTTVPREELALAQTPQAFRLDALRAAHARAAAAGLEVTDDAQALEAAGCLVRAIPGDPMNVKITTMLDLARAEARMGGADA
ncbi:MAG: 2-C-methyl-D-erythritol 4-phosphate cytidylyltransferase [Actinomycetota bacterium]